MMEDQRKERKGKKNEEGRWNRRVERTGKKRKGEERRWTREEKRRGQKRERGKGRRE